MVDLSIGVCGWCIDRFDVRRSVAVAAELGFSAIQVGFFSREAIETFRRTEVSASHESSIHVVGAFIAFEGEDYSSITRIAETGGLAADDRYEERAATINQVVDLAADQGLPSVALHVGTIPSDSTAPLFLKLVDRTRRTCDACAAKGLRLLVETGRESAQTLVAFLVAVDRPNLGVNFDTGNFTVYGTDDPVFAVSKLKGRIELVHLKDAFASSSPGREYGKPAPLGQGDVNVARVISKLRATGYRGPLLLEIDSRSSGTSVLRDAAAYLRTMLS